MKRLLVGRLLCLVGEHDVYRPYSLRTGRVKAPRCRRCSQEGASE